MHPQTSEVKRFVRFVRRSGDRLADIFVYKHSPSSSGLVRRSPCLLRLWHPLMCILLNYFFMSCSLFSSRGNRPPLLLLLIPIHLRWPCVIGTRCCSAPTSPCCNPCRPYSESVHGCVAECECKWMAVAVCQEGINLPGLPPLPSPHTPPSLKRAGESELQPAVTENFDLENGGSINHVMWHHQRAAHSCLPASLWCFISIQDDRAVVSQVLSGSSVRSLAAWNPLWSFRVSACEDSGSDSRSCCSLMMLLVFWSSVSGFVARFWKQSTGPTLL